MQIACELVYELAFLLCQVNSLVFNPVTYLRAVNLREHRAHDNGKQKHDHQ